MKPVSLAAVFGASPNQIFPEKSHPSLPAIFLGVIDPVVSAFFLNGYNFGGTFFLAIIVDFTFDRAVTRMIFEIFL